VAFAARAFAVLPPIFLLAVTAPALAQSPTDRGLFSPTPFGAQTATAPSLPNDTPEKPSRLPRWVVFDFASGIKTVEFADGSRKVLNLGHATQRHHVSAERWVACDLGPTWEA
jgi:hypothetical protein